MFSYKIVFSENANADIQNLTDTIIFQYKAPITAFRYIQGLIDEIKKLSFSAESFKIQNAKFFLQYGHNVRCIRYKSMTIIYQVVNDVVYIQRVLASSLITK